MAITLKKLSGDTEVVANPTLDGSETALSGLQIDGVKYAMGGGGNLKWVKKASGRPTNQANKPHIFEGDYVGKLICFNYKLWDCATQPIAIMCENTEYLNVELIKKGASTTIYGYVFTKNGVLNFQNTTTTEYQVDLYVLEVA